MTSIVTGLAALVLGTGAAQAQDGDLVGTYEVDCTVNEIQVAVRAAHNGMPAGTLYIDAFLLPLDCTGEITSSQIAELQEDILASCAIVSPGLPNCEQIAADVADIVERDGGISPVDRLAITEVVTQDPEGPDAVLMSIDLTDKMGPQRFRALVNDDGVFSTNRQLLRRQPVSDTQMSCTQWGARGSFGVLDAEMKNARMEYRRTHNLFCLTNTTKVLEVQVEIDAVSRAESMD